jgi:thioesterase domain-containing protein
MRMLAEAETRFGRPLPPAEFAGPLTPARLAEAIDLEGAAAEVSHIASLQPLGERPTLFCVPGIEATALTFYFLARACAPRQPVAVLQGGWIDGPGSPDGAIAAIAARHIATLRAWQPAGPYWLCGYSMGARIALEMATQLRAQGHHVGGLIVLDAQCPGVRHGWRQALALARGFLRNLPHWVRDDLAPGGWLQFRRNVARHLRRALGIGGQPAIARALDPGRLTPAELRVREARYLAARAHRAAPYPGRVTLIRARTRPLLRPLVDPALGWGAVAAGGVSVHEVPGNHMTMLARPHAAAFAALLQAVLADPEPAAG